MVEFRAGVGPRLRTCTAVKDNMAGGGLRAWIRVQGQGLGSAQPVVALECRGSGPRPQQAPYGPGGWGKHWLCSFLILQSPKGLSASPLLPSLWVGHSRCGNPSPPPATPQGHPSHPASISPPPHHVLPGFLRVLPIPFGVHGPSQVPGRCPSCKEM